MFHCIHLVFHIVIFSLFCVAFLLTTDAVGGTSPRVSQVVPVIQARNIEVCRGGLVQAPKWNGRCGGIIAMEASGENHWSLLLHSF